jgi:hypothetical protein
MSLVLYKVNIYFNSKTLKAFSRNKMSFIPAKSFSIDGDVSDF